MSSHRRIRQTLVIVATLLVSVIPVQAQWLDNGTHIYNSNTGNVGVGTTSPVTKLHIVGGDLSLASNRGIRRDGNNLLFFYSTTLPGVNMGSGTSTDRFTINAGGVERIRFETDGNVGIGTKTPTSLLHLRDRQFTQVPSSIPPSSTNLYIERALTVGSEASIVVQGSTKGSGGGGRLYLGNADEFDSTSIVGGVGSVVFYARNGGAAAAEVARISPAGNFTVAGNLAAKYQDIAEWVPATTELAPGTVVTLNSERTNEVMQSARAYDTMVAGVVSEQPGLILGERESGMEKIATMGRVRVRVDASKRPVRVGDLLVTSETPGTAMASEPIELGGILIHRPGTILGKALEPLPSGQGEILVLLTLQ